MTVTNPPMPQAFTNDDFAARMNRVVSAAVEKGLAGVIVTPGPDLVWLTGYRPTAITERFTMLVLSPDSVPTLLVPILERPDAEAAEGAGMPPHSARATAPTLISLATVRGSRAAAASMGSDIKPQVDQRSGRA
jgi:Xaa-Pro aminopeptidase